MTTCPSGVHYQHLIDHARVHVERTYRRPWLERTLRVMLALVLPYPERFRWAVRLAAFARPFAQILPAQLRAMLALAPRRLPARREEPSAAVARRDPGADTRRVAVVTGCVQTVVGPQINAATIRLLERIGIDVVAIPGCCGSIVHHLGRDRQSKSLAAPLIERLHAEHESNRLEAIVVNASGCGTQLKDYNHIFRDDAALAHKAKTISALTRDVTEFLGDCELPAPVIPAGLAVAYHSACSMQHGQKIDRAPRELLARAGFTVKEIPEGHLCCGSAGTYNLLQPEIAGRLRDRKLANVERANARIVATGNIGCITQLAAGASVPVVHTVELLDWATGGPRPATFEPN
jgi:glycolate oxidase iron-sulfur subunit